MPSLEVTLARFRPRLTELVREHQAPGVSFAVARGDDVFCAAAGIANLNTGLEVTTDTKFLIGSNTKALTIALMCRAADDGLVGLDERVITYLPEFRTADQATTRNVTIRHLLLHTSGIGGDFFLDYNRGDDAIKLLVDNIFDAGIMHPLGLTWSYSNASYSVVGRILEVVHGKPYAAVLRERLLAPLGMDETALSPEESILGSTAVGHVADDSGGLRVTSHYALPQAFAPAGAIVNCTARDLVKFGRMLLDRGITQSGERLLQEDTVAEMFKPALLVPAPLSESYMCLSMIFEQNPTHRLYRSSGSTTGQGSVFHLLPEQDLILVGLGNGPGGNAVSNTMFSEVIRELTGIEPPSPAPLPETRTDVDLRPYAGTYEGMTAVWEVAVDDNELTLTSRGKPVGRDEPFRNPSGVSADAANRQAPALRLRPVGDHQFLLSEGGPSGCTFLEVKDGQAEYLWLSNVSRRVRGRRAEQG